MSKTQKPHPQKNPAAALGNRTSDLAPPFTPAFLRTRDVLRITSLSRATLYRRVNARRFPAPVHLGGRACGWPVAAIQEWISNPNAYLAETANDQRTCQVRGRPRKKPEL